MKDLIVKDNALINASYNLDLVEQRLVLLAIIEARESGKGINANDPLVIHAESYINQFNVHRNTAYQALKDACNDLFVRQFSYQTVNERGNIENYKSRWVSEIGYVEDEAVVKLIFSPAIVPLITRLEERFTKYDLQQVSKLSSAYAIRLYELLISWRSTGIVPVRELQSFRQQLGVSEHDYNRMYDFKNRVLEPAIKQINEHTDIKVKYEQHKKGRSIIGFSFRFKQKNQPIPAPNKPQHEPKSVDFFVEMSDAQRYSFASKLADLHEVGSEYAVAGESNEDFIKRLADMLLEPKKFRMFYPLLEQIGFSSKRNQSMPVKQINEPEFLDLSNMQINRISYNISTDKKFIHLKQENESNEDFTLRLRIMLKDPKQQIQFHDYLKSKSKK